MATITTTTTTATTKQQQPLIRIPPYETIFPNQSIHDQIATILAADSIDDLVYFLNLNFKSYQVDALSTEAIAEVHKLAGEASQQDFAACLLGGRGYVVLNGRQDQIPNKIMTEILSTSNHLHISMVASAALVAEAARLNSNSLQSSSSIMTPISLFYSERLASLESILLLLRNVPDLCLNLVDELNLVPKLLSMLENVVREQSGADYKHKTDAHLQDYHHQVKQLILGLLFFIHYHFEADQVDLKRMVDIMYLMLQHNYLDDEEFCVGYLMLSLLTALDTSKDSVIIRPKVASPGKAFDLHALIQKYVNEGNSTGINTNSTSPSTTDSAIGLLSMAYGLHALDHHRKVDGEDWDTFDEAGIEYIQTALDYRSFHFCSTIFLPKLLETVHSSRVEVDFSLEVLVYLLSRYCSATMHIVGLPATINEIMDDEANEKDLNEPSSYGNFTGYFYSRELSTSNTSLDRKTFIDSPNRMRDAAEDVLRLIQQLVGILPEASIKFLDEINDCVAIAPFTPTFDIREQDTSPHPASGTPSKKRYNPIAFIEGLQPKLNDQDFIDLMAALCTPDTAESIFNYLSNISPNYWEDLLNKLPDNKLVENILCLVSKVMVVPEAKQLLYFNNIFYNSNVSNLVGILCLIDQNKANAVCHTLAAIIRNILSTNTKAEYAGIVTRIVDWCNALDISVDAALLNLYDALIHYFSEDKDGEKQRNNEGSFSDPLDSLAIFADYQQLTFLTNLIEKTIKDDICSQRIVYTIFTVAGEKSKLRKFTVDRFLSGGQLCKLVTSNYLDDTFSSIVDKQQFNPRSVKYNRSSNTKFTTALEFPMIKYIEIFNSLSIYKRGFSLRDVLLSQCFNIIRKFAKSIEEDSGEEMITALCELLRYLAMDSRWKPMIFEDESMFNALSSKISLSCVIDLLTEFEVSPSEMYFRNAIRRGEKNTLEKLAQLLERVAMSNKTIFQLDDHLQLAYSIIQQYTLHEMEDAKMITGLSAVLSALQVFLNKTMPERSIMDIVQLMNSIMNLPIIIAQGGRPSFLVQRMNGIILRLAFLADAGVLQVEKEFRCFLSTILQSENWSILGMLFDHSVFYMIRLLQSGFESRDVINILGLFGKLPRLTPSLCLCLSDLLLFHKETIFSQTPKEVLSQLLQCLLENHDNDSISFSPLRELISENVDVDEYQLRKWVNKAFKDDGSDISAKIETILLLSKLASFKSYRDILKELGATAALLTNPLMLSKKTKSIKDYDSNTLGLLSAQCTFLCHFPEYSSKFLLEHKLLFIELLRVYPLHGSLTMKLASLYGTTTYHDPEVTANCMEFVGGLGCNLFPAKLMKNIDSFILPSESYSSYQGVEHPVTHIWDKMNFEQDGNVLLLPPPPTALHWQPPLLSTVDNKFKWSVQHNAEALYAFKVMDWVLTYLVRGIHKSAGTEVYQSIDVVKLVTALYRCVDATRAMHDYSKRDIGSNFIGNEENEELSLSYKESIGMMQSTLLVSAEKLMTLLVFYFKEAARVSDHQTSFKNAVEEFRKIVLPVIDDLKFEQNGLIRQGDFASKLSRALKDLLYDA